MEHSSAAADWQSAVLGNALSVAAGSLTNGITYTFRFIANDGSIGYAERIIEVADAPVRFFYVLWLVFVILDFRFCLLFIDDWW